MQPEDLVKVWEAPDHSRLTPKQMSLRLPITVAAKVNALCDIFPRKTKTEIIGDLLAAALDQIENAFPCKKGELIGHEPPHDEPVYQDVGLRGRFRELSEKHVRDLEREAGIKDPIPMPRAVTFEREAEG